MTIGPYYFDYYYYYITLHYLGCRFSATEGATQVSAFDLLRLASLAVAGVALQVAAGGGGGPMQSMTLTPGGG